jgi:hypothetical protein
MNITTQAILSRFRGDRNQAARYCHDISINRNLSLQTREEYRLYTNYFLLRGEAANA